MAGAAANFPRLKEDLQSDTVRVAVVGMGGRGTGAIGQILDAPKDLAKDKNIRCNTKLVAVADSFPEKSVKKIEAFKKKYGEDRVDVEGRIFGGLDGYKQAINEDVDMVVIATPPVSNRSNSSMLLIKVKRFYGKTVASV